MGNKFVQQVKVVTGQSTVRAPVSLHEMAFFDEDGDPVSVGYTPAAHVAKVTAPNGSDAATTQTLANANKVTINQVIDALVAAGLMA